MVLRALDVRRLLVVGVAFAVGTGLACKQQEERKVEDPTKAVFEGFSKRIDDYMKMRKTVVDSVGELDPTKSQAEITTRATQLATGIMAARAQAKPGDIFTPEFSALMATLIKQEYSRRPDSVQETREDQQDELPDFVPKVNMLYPTTYPLATFPATLLPLLPKLPEQLEYRVVQHYLVLRDIEANVIVDVMPNAVPA